MTTSDRARFTGYMNGEWVPSSELKIGVWDRGVRGGDSVFDVTRTFNGKSFRLKEHVDRLYRSLNYTRIDPGLSAEEMFELSEEAIQRNEHLLEESGDFAVRQIITRGPGYWVNIAGPPTVIIEVAPNAWHAAAFYDAGAHCVIARTRSYSAESLDPKVKHYSRMNFNLADLEAKDVDPQAWPVLTDTDGNLTEGVGYNIFLVTDGVIRSPGDSAMLQGISRGAIFDVAAQLNIPVVQEPLQPYDLYTADEAFIANTNFCVLPVTKVDTRPIGDGVPGPIVAQLLAAWSEMVGVDIVDQQKRFHGK